jgi:hypothetical protein
MPYGAIPVTGQRIVDGTITIDDLAQAVWSCIPSCAVSGAALAACSVGPEKLSFDLGTPFDPATAYDWDACQAFRCGVTVGQSGSKTDCSRFLCHGVVEFQWSSCTADRFIVQFPWAEFHMPDSGRFSLIDTVASASLHFQFAAHGAMRQVNVSGEDSLDLLEFTVPARFSVPPEFPMGLVLPEYGPAQDGAVWYCSCEGAFYGWNGSSAVRLDYNG